MTKIKTKLNLKYKHLMELFSGKLEQKDFEYIVNPFIITTKTKKKNKMKILGLFTSTKEEKDAKVATRVAKGLKRGQEALIDGLEARVDAAQEVMDRLVEGKIKDIDTKLSTKSTMMQKWISL